MIFDKRNNERQSGWIVESKVNLFLIVYVEIWMDRVRWNLYDILNEDIDEWFTIHMVFYGGTLESWKGHKSVLYDYGLLKGILRVMLRHE